MTDSWTAVPSESRGSSWSKRILIAAVAGILFLTLYPFSFSVSRYGLAFLLVGWGKGAGPVDAFLNVLLFVPYGFGLTEALRERGKSRAAVLGVALLAGMLFSYTVELLQFYIPMRDSGWGDVVTNSAGSVLGFLVYELAGASILRFASRIESAIVTWLRGYRLALVLLLYVGVWLAISVPLQREARISDWSPNAVLLIGGSTVENPFFAWRGKISEAQLWNRALPGSVARAITSGGAPDIPAPLASYDLWGLPPFQDQRHFLPDLMRMRGASPPRLAGVSELISRAPVSSLVDQIERTNQFSLHVVYEAGPMPLRHGRILSLAQTSGAPDLELRQENTNLSFWFRNSLSAGRPRLAWDVANVFVPNQLRSLVLSYDGSRLALYVDGKEVGRPYQLGPGTGLAALLHRIKWGELDGYRHIFYAMIFLPVGCLLGLGWRNLASPARLRLLVVVLGAVVLPVLFEIVLAYAGSTSVWIGNIVLSMLLVLGAAFWVNADQSLTRPFLGDAL
jgi:ABC-type glycerol-3-phosphate transport system permease component